MAATNDIPVMPNAGSSSGYRMASSSLTHAVDVFETPAALGHESPTPRLEPPIPIAIAEPLATQILQPRPEPSDHTRPAEAIDSHTNPPQPPVSSTTSEKIDTIISSVHDLKQELFDLIEAKKTDIRALMESRKTTSIPATNTSSRTTIPEADFGELIESLGPLDEGYVLCSLTEPGNLDYHFYHQLCINQQEIPQTLQGIHEGETPLTESEISDTEIIATQILQPELHSANNATATPEVESNHETHPTKQVQSGHGQPPTNDNRPSHAYDAPETLPISNTAAKHTLHAPQTSLALPATPSAPITPMSPIFDIDHTSLASSQSSPRSRIAHEDGPQTLGRTAPRPSISQGGNVAIRNLGPSIMLALFD